MTSGKAKRASDNIEAIFLTADQLEERAVAQIRLAQQLPPGRVRQHALNNAVQLRSFAAMKRLLVPNQPDAISANGVSDVYN